MRQKYWILSITLTLILAPVGPVRAETGSGQQVATDETLMELFGKHHDIMKDQRQRLHNVLDGFLTADTEIIGRNAKEIAAAIGEVNEAFPPQPGQEKDVWKILSELLDSAQQLDKSISERRYSEAYQHYMVLTGKCVQCHQVRREWGKFPVEEKEEEQERSGGGSR
ncbi:MAG: hypothetical protein NC819_03895 [Candidatus Omnitrophica bacterium]|nr:hypothetical protein [Candidatus Omnitrophota bacterium]